MKFNANLSVLHIVIGDMVIKFWFVLTNYSVIVAADAWFTIIVGVKSSISSLG